MLPRDVLERRGRRRLHLVPGGDVCGRQRLGRVRTLSGEHLLLRWVGLVHGMSTRNVLSTRLRDVHPQQHDDDDAPASV
jgi:hypothetical protein